MPRTYPVLGYSTLADAAVAMLAEGKTCEEIAELVGREPGQIRASVSSKQQAKTPRTVILPMGLFGKLAKAAAERGIDAPQLALQLLGVLAEDDAIDALLGEVPSSPNASLREASDA